MSECKSKVVKLDNFVIQNVKAKSHSPIQNLIHHICREVNRQKLDYLQLKYIFKVVRERCEVTVPSTTGRKLYELPTNEEINRFYAVIKNPIHRLIFETLEGTGVRVDELCSLEVKRIDLEKNLAFISQGKGSKDRIVIVGRRLAEKLTIYLQGKRNRYLFESNRHTRFSTRRIEQLCKQFKKKAGIEKDLTPHTWRHIFNTRLSEAGIPEEKRAVLAGHDDKDSQKIYTHLGVAGIKDEVLAVLDRIDRRNDEG